MAAGFPVFLSGTKWRLRSPKSKGHSPHRPEGPALTGSAQGFGAEETRTVFIELTRERPDGLPTPRLM